MWKDLQRHWWWGILLDSNKPEGVTETEKEIIKQLAGNYKVDINVTTLGGAKQKKLDIKIY